MPGFFDQLQSDFKTAFGDRRPSAPRPNFSQPQNIPSFNPPQNFAPPPMQMPQPMPQMAPPQNFAPPPMQMDYAPMPMPQMAPPMPMPQMAPPMPMPQMAPPMPMQQAFKPFHAGVLVVKAPSGALVVSGVDPKSTMWGEQDIKVGDVLVAVDGKETSSLGDALKMLAGPEGSQVTVQTEFGTVSVPRDSNCSLGPAAPRGPAAPMGGPGPQGAVPLAFDGAPGSAMSPQECAALGLPPGSKWGGKSGGGAPAYAGYNGGSIGGGSDSFLSI